MELYRLRMLLCCWTLAMPFLRFYHRREIYQLQFKIRWAIFIHNLMG